MYAHPSTLAGSEEDQEDQLIDDGKRYDDSQIVFTAVEAFKYFTQVYSRVLSSTRPYQALTIKYNKANDLSEKLSLSCQLFLSHPPGQKPAPGRTRPISGTQEKAGIDCFVKKGKCRLFVF